MEDTKDIEQRLIDLEVKASFADDLLDQLNQALFRQQQLIDSLTREVAQLRKRLPEGDEAASRSADELPPPHY